MPEVGRVADAAWRRFLDAHGELAWSDDPYNPETTSANFDLDAYLARFDPRLLTTPEGRKALTRLDPMLFALVYMRKHLRNNEGDLSFADAHFLWVRAARRWIGPPRGQREDRKAFVAPRSCGKSTWWFLILPMWAGAHQHARFAAAFADSGAQAELHLATFKRELSDNPLLRADFEDLCEPKRRHNGKCLDVDTELLTARGWTTMSDVKVGDEVYHPAGHRVTVTEVHDVITGADCYRITTTDRRSLVADADHLWTVTDKRIRGKGVSQLRTLSTREIVEGGWWKDARQREGRYVLPVQEPLKTPDIDLPVDPYLLGAWLGDGSSWHPLIHCHRDEVDHWSRVIRDAGFTPSARLDHDDTWIVAANKGEGGSFRAHLVALNLLRNKHVPDAYLTAGTDQRAALLQGLLDTDGYASLSQGQVEFCSTNRGLADAALFLARSLGWRATLREGRSTLNGRDCGPKYRVMFTPVETDSYSPFQLPRKAARVRPTDGGKGRNVVSIAAVERVESRPVRCIRVDSPDGLFLAGRDLIATHNTINDSQNMLFTKSGFAFAARGIDSTSLGMKVDEVRPDLLIFDDIEPPESNYSPFQRDKRLSTVQNAILPLNELARVVVVGTVTMPGSIIHELVRHAKGEDVEPWVEEEKFKTFHTRPIIIRPDGTERSVWPKKWTWDYLNSIRNTRSFKLNYDNDPKGRQGDYWNAEDIHYGTPPNITKWFLFVDPPVTQKTRSDFAGVALVGYAPGSPKAAVTREELTMYGRDKLLEMLTAREVKETAEGKAARLSQVCIVDAWQVKLTGAPLKRFLLDRLAEYPQVQAVVVENNNGGDLWIDVFSGLPVKLVTYGSYESKEVRFARALDFCQKNRVTFGRIIPPLEDQLLGFPRLANDDLLDAACAGMLRLLTPRHAQKDGTLTPR